MTRNALHALRSVSTLLAVLAAAGTLAAQDTARRPPDVVLVTVDTLRADAPGFAGNPAVETPVLDRLAAAGRVFSNAHAHNVVTLPSHANILTGRYPYQHGVRDNGGFRLGRSVPTMATVLRDAGYATAAFVAAFPLDSTFGLDRGFEVYDDRYPEGSDPTEFSLPERRGDEVVAAALAWWRERRGGPRFLWVHLFDPHAPYAPPEPFASRYRDRPYLGEVAATDAFLAPLIEPFLAGSEPPALLAVTADHGEALGEHGELTHGLFAYEPTLAVPLVLWGRGVEPGRDPRPARHVDLFPTVLEVAGVPVPEGLPGRSLLQDAAEEVETYFEALSANLNRGWAPLRGVIRGGRKLIALPLPELYDLARDPAEAENGIADANHRIADANNRIGAEGRLARELLRRLPAESVWPPERGAVDAETARRLESLGYLAGSAAARDAYGPEDDPKNLVELDRAMHQVIDLYSRGELAKAVELARSVVERRPSMPMGRSLLAQALLEHGEVDEALEVMRRARADGVVTETLLRQLGLTLAERGAAAEALAVLRPLADDGDPRSLNALALALSEAGSHREAETVLGGVLAADPDNPRAHEQLGLVALSTGRWAAARDASRRALELNGELPLAWNNLGVALYRLGDAGGALDAWQRATELDPGLYDALYNLGTKALDHGRDDQARDALARFVAGAPEARYAADLKRARVLLRRLERTRE